MVQVFAVIKERSLEQVFVKLIRSAVDRWVKKIVNTSDGRDNSVVMGKTSGIFRPKSLQFLLWVLKFGDILVMVVFYKD